MKIKFSDCSSGISVGNISELIKAFETIREKYGDLKVGNDEHWEMWIDTLPSGCLVGTADDGTDALDIEVQFT